MEQVRDASTEFFALPPPRRAVPAWRRFGVAALGSLALHGGVVALALLLLGRIPHSESPRELWVQLAPNPQLAESELAERPAVAAAPAPAARPAPAAPQRAVSSESKASPATEPAPTPVQAAPAIATTQSESPAAMTTADPTPPPASDEAVESRVPAIEAHVLDWLARYRSYPRAARRAGIEGVVTVSTVLGRDGTLGERRVAASSGHDVLDRAALELLARASPLPPLPDLPREVELRLPIVYRLNR